MTQSARGKLTILIPTHRRPELLARALAHYQDCGLPVIAADSSPEPFALAARFPFLRLLHLPGTPFEAKLQILASLVQTPYAVLCADDDLTSPASMAECVAFLEGAGDHSGAHGHYLRALRGPGGIIVEPCYRDTHRAGLRAADAETRLLELNRPYVPLFYAVLRAEALRLAFGPGHETENFYASSELALGMAVAMLGKVAVLPTLHTVREIIPSVDLAGPRNDDLGVVSTAPQYREVFGRFVARLARAMAAACGLPEDRARAAVLASVAGYVDGYCRKGRRRTFIEKLPKYCRRAARVLVPALARKARAEAQAAREADLAAYLAPAGPNARAELAAMLRRMGETA